MRILLCSHVFPPSVGGIETVSSILADQFSRLVSTVTVVTYTPGDEFSTPYRLVRRPSSVRLRKLAAESDIIFQCNISLRTLSPLLFSDKPTFISHHGWLTRPNGKRGWREYLKLAMLHRYHNIAISEALGATLPVDSIVIGNPYEPEEFQDLGEAYRTRDIVFMGRLVSDKGCDLILRALARLKAEGICATFSIIGDGPEVRSLKRLTEELRLSSQVSFRGVLREGRGKEVGRHKIMVIPSTCNEGFGVVALEGIASGCVVVGSNAGGLPEAIGPCGVLFPRGDVPALACALKELLQNASMREKLMSQRSRHLGNFQPEVIARRYLETFESAMGHDCISSNDVACADKSGR